MIMYKYQELYLTLFVSFKTLILFQMIFSVIRKIRSVLYVRVHVFRSGRKIN